MATEVTTVEVGKVYGPRKAGKGEVYGFKFQDEQWSAWNKVGEKLADLAPGTFEVEYELRPNQGYNNPTVLKVISGNLPASAAPSNSKGQSSSDDEKKRSIAVSYAKDLYIAKGEIKGNLEDILAIAEYAQGFLDLIEGTFSTFEEEAVAFPFDEEEVA